MPIIKQGELITIGSEEEDLTDTYKVLRRFDWDTAFKECVKNATEREIKADHYNRYDGELFIVEWLCAEGILEKVPTSKHIITIVGNKYTFHK